MSLLVDNPILNSPFEEPTRYWASEGGQPVLKEGRRPVGYYLKARTRGPQMSLLEEEFVPLDWVNTIRERVKAWRERGYPGVTLITRQLLNHWNNPEREGRGMPCPFFCQREAAETLIWLVEASPAEKQGIAIPKDEALTRYACKMAAGSGKTVVMGMVIAWQVLNKLASPQDRRFSDAVLLVCPNLTIRERLKVLLPWKPGNYYDKFDLVPRELMERLQQGKFEVTNWHLFQPKDDRRSRSVVQRGAESDAAFCRRVLRDLGHKGHILVINDEAHHAYRPAPLSEEDRKGLTPEEIEEREEATIWISGLDRIHREWGINFCTDFSATPFYIQGSGYEEGTPFPWIVSDFGLGETRKQMAERLRNTVNTIGKTEWEGEGEPPGQRIRCVISVGMLNEGWDAQNVTQILGLRAFTSQLLCEQVVGRGLRRLNYDDFSEPEYVDVYGVPFEVIPIKKKPLSRTEVPRVSTLMRALPERKHLEITFPRVEGYVFDVRQRIRLNLEDVLGPGPEAIHDRSPFHQEKRLQTTVYEIAAEVTSRLKGKREEWSACHILFPQVLNCVWQYLEERVILTDPETPLGEIALLKYKQRIVERLLTAIEPDEESRERPLLLVIERFRPIGSTSEVSFRTSRPCVETSKSHISHVVLDAPHWEHTAAYQLERTPEVIAYARNDHLDFVIPYKYEGRAHEYRPDYLIRWRASDGSEVKIILEIKGLETERDRQKETAAQRWVRAVNHHGGFGRWTFTVCKNPWRLPEVLRKAVGQLADPQAEN